MSNIDSLGRIVIPKPLRDAANLPEGTPVTFSLQEDGVFLRAAEARCVFCESAKDLFPHGTKHVCSACLCSLQKTAKKRKG